MADPETSLECLDKDNFVTDLLLPAAWFNRLDIFQYCADLSGNVHMTANQAVLENFGIPTGRSLNDGYLFKTWSPLALAAAAGHIRMIDYIFGIPYPKEDDIAAENIGKALVAAAAFERLDVVCHFLASEVMIAIPGIIVGKFEDAITPYHRGWDGMASSKVDI
ncbi:hypothetical protein MMC15_005219 [Xylographa vitiligo]|nr:hypothetical protein [Xylographa vitiligo]